MPPTAKRSGDEGEGAPKKRGGGSSRTGQACDRCKVRKIRCDARIGGCSPCLQNNSECKTTDRITGRATARGHAETLENDNASLKMYVVELQQQLRDHGVDPKAAPSVPQGYAPAQAYWGENEQQQGSWGDLSTGNGLLPTNARTERQGSSGSVLPEFRPGCIGDNYLGVSSGNNWLSPIEGTSLQLFGMKIDLAEFLPSESDPTASLMSYQTFLQHSFGKAQHAKTPSLPSYEECKQYADIYFKNVQVFIPVLHRPDFMKLLARISQTQYQPNSAETVMVHMVISIMKFQFACRNGAEHMRGESMSHYHYSLSLIPDLITGHTLEDIQALVLICSQLRSQPRPGAVWMFTNMVFGITVEVGLHRSASNWQGAAAERDPHTIEMRKRIFYSILLLHVTISGKLGRPMPIRLEDFDIEIPEAASDHMPGENLTKWRRCSFRAAIQGAKLIKILLQVYATVYSVRSGAEPYDLSVQNLNKQLNNWRDQVPSELSGGPQTVEEDRSPALYLQTAEQSARIVLHHPSLCRTLSPVLMANNLDTCLNASSRMLSAALQLKEIKSLDTTWMMTTDYLAAIFTTLFTYTQRQDQMSSANLQQLRQDMDGWLDILGDLGSVLGAGLRLREAVKQIVDFSLNNINRHFAAKTASAGLASASSPDSPVEPSPRQQSFTAASSYQNAYVNGVASDGLPRSSRQSFSMNEHTGTQQHQQYAAVGSIYPAPPNTAMASYSPMSSAAFDSSTYNSADFKSAVQGHLHAHNSGMPAQPAQRNSLTHMTPQQAPASFSPAFHSPSHLNGFHPTPQPGNMSHFGPVAWRNFADTMMTNMGGNEDMSSASALMALGGDKYQAADPLPNNVASFGSLQVAPDGQQAWPQLLGYHPPSGGGQ